MDTDWSKSPISRHVLAFAGDARPAWLWSADGETLVWSNAAAAVFAELQSRRREAASQAVPIKGQIPRVLRLSMGSRSSLSRIQFSAGGRPCAATCHCTPLVLPDRQSALLVVGVDPVPAEKLAALLPAQASEAAPAAAELPTGNPDLAEPDSPFPVEFETGLPLAALENIPERASESAEAAAVPDTRLSSLFDRLAQDEELFSPLPSADPEVGPGVSDAAPVDHAATLGQDGSETAGNVLISDPAEPVAETSAPPEPVAEPPVPAPTLQPAREEPAPPESGQDERAGSVLPETSLPASDGEEPKHEEGAAAPSPATEERAPSLFRVTGRGFRRLAALGGDPVDLGPVASVSQPIEAEVTAPESVIVTAEPAALDAAGEPAREAGDERLTPPPIPDSETVERASRYNFDELSRILTDRVGGMSQDNSGASPLTIEGIVAASESGQPGRGGPEAGGGALTPAGQGGALVNLSGETLVLNRLPLGILVFRDQQVLFANRAITAMIGYNSVEELRQAGLAAIFPASGEETQGGGPVNHLVQRDGTLVPVTARLQSTSWQGRPALMLSASATEVRTSHEGAVRAFAEMIAETRGDGFIETNRLGVVSLISPRGAQILGRRPDGLLGRPLTQLIAPDEIAPLKIFLERPARFAETARPCLSLKAQGGAADLLLFAQGQAGLVTGYFGMVRSLAERASALPSPRTDDPDPNLLSRISRGVRRPLNTIVGFSDLIGTEAFGPLENPRYREYAMDIRSAGNEIAALIDELDDYTRLKDGRYLPVPAEVDLGGLLESCVVRVRTQANAARVLVRSAISERLPRITADRPSLGQAILNLLASAIDQTTPGGSVVISATKEENGSVSIHVRDSAKSDGDLSDRFVVFRDGLGRDGEQLAPVRSSVGLALTRSLLSVNGARLSVSPVVGSGTLFAVTLPAGTELRSLPRPAGRAD